MDITRFDRGLSPAMAQLAGREIDPADMRELTDAYSAGDGWYDDMPTHAETVATAHERYCLADTPGRGACVRAPGHDGKHRDAAGNEFELPTSHEAAPTLNDFELDECDGADLPADDQEPTLLGLIMQYRDARVADADALLEQIRQQLGAAPLDDQAATIDAMRPAIRFDTGPDYVMARQWALAAYAAGAALANRTAAPLDGPVPTLLELIVEYGNLRESVPIESECGSPAEADELAAKATALLERIRGILDDVPFGEVSPVTLEPIPATCASRIPGRTDDQCTHDALLVIAARGPVATESLPAGLVGRLVGAGLAEGTDLTGAHLALTDAGQRAAGAERARMAVAVG